MKKLLIIIFSGMLLWSCNDEIDHEIIKKELMKPYFEVLLKEDFDTAYHKYTSTFYRGHSNYQTFLNSYQKAISHKGKLKDFKINKLVTIWKISGDTEYNVEVSVSFNNQDYSMPVVYGVSKSEDGHYKINHGWFHNKYGIPDGFDGPY